MGLALAGFDVVGVDQSPQPNYPFDFHQGDALEHSLEGFDFVWASPPCQAFCAYKRRPGHVRPALNLIPATRERLRRAGMPYVIENVEGARAHLLNPVKLCGSSFYLDVRRHRLFEAHGFTIKPVDCNHGWQTARFAPATNRKNLRRTVEVGVYRIPLKIQRAAMAIGWMSLKELSQAIPPAYSRHIGICALSSGAISLGPDP